MGTGTGPYGACRSTQCCVAVWSRWVESSTRLGGFKALKKTPEAPYTTKVNYRDPTSRGTTRRHSTPLCAARTHLEVSSMHYCTLMISCVWHGAYVKYRIHMQSRETERCMSGPGERGGGAILGPMQLALAAARLDETHRHRNVRETHGLSRGRPADTTLHIVQVTQHLGDTPQRST